MGLIFSKVWQYFPMNKNVRILMVGLDAAGKTTLLYKMKLNEYVTTIPTIGFNVETVQYKNINFTLWDIGGQVRIRTLWKHYFQHTNAVIFVIDSHDRDRIGEAKYELQQLMNDPDLPAKLLLVYANKQDLQNPIKSDEMVKELDLQNLKGITWHVQETVATKEVGVYEGLNWLSKELGS